MMDLLDSKYYAEACRKYGAIWDAEREEEVRQTVRKEEKRHLIFVCIKKRLPDSNISSETLKKLEQIDDLQKLDKIFDFSFDVPTMKDFEDFVANQ